MSIQTQTAAARQASRTLASLDTHVKDAYLSTLANRIEMEHERILDANALDLEQSADLPSAKRQRLVLTDDAIRQMSAGLRAIAELPDPVGTVTSDTIRPNGLHVRRMRCPIGVVAMIYEARPAVTIDAFSLCFKAGNACILKGGKEADASNRALADIARSTLDTAALPPDALIQMTSTSREDIKEMLSLHDDIDLVIPRGGESLISFVNDNTRIPTVKHFHGICHIYAHSAADIDKAIPLITLAKTSAPATCNALECVLVDRTIADKLIPTLVRALIDASVEIRADEESRAHAANAEPATDADFGHEFLDNIIAMKVVGGIDEAIAHIRTHGSAHTDAILTEDTAAAERFTRDVQSSCVLINASTRFNDGFQLGLGAEIGISTQRVHAFGPMGLEELTVQRFVVEGDGQCR